MSEHNESINLRLLSVKAAGVSLGLSAPTLWRMIARAELPVCRIGRRTLIDCRDIEELIERRKTRQLGG